jgi:hypothetical protein
MMATAMLYTYFQNAGYRSTLLLSFLLISFQLQAQRVRDTEYVIQDNRLNIMYMMDPVPQIHKPGWTYGIEVRVEGKVLGGLKPDAVTGDINRVYPSEFQRQILWEVYGDADRLSDQLKVNVQVMDMGGPRFARKSILVPGAGLKFVTGRNQIGLLRTFSVYALLGTSILTRLGSRRAYTEYMREETAMFVDNHYASANRLHQMSIITGVAGLGLWVWDIFNTAHKGRMNKKYLNRPLKVKPTASPATGHVGMLLQCNLSR